MKRPAPAPVAVQDILEGADASLLDLVDHVLNQGVVISGEIVLGVADVDLIYVGISAVICASDRMFLPGEERGS